METNDNKQKEIDKIVKLVNKSDISSIKQTVTRIIQIINDPDSSARDLKNLIEVDPPLTAKLLKLANSAFYGYPKTISNIQEAIVCIGFDAVQELALSQKVCELFKKADYINGYSRPALWKHSVAVALCSKFIYRRELGKLGENIYVAGLLHDIGIIVLDQFCHERFREIIKKYRREKNNLINVESAILGFNHTDIACALMIDWEFPDEIVKIITNHHQPDLVEDEFETISRTIYIANHAVQDRLIGFCDALYKNRTLFRKCLMRLNIKEQAIDLIIKEVEEEISKMEKSGWF